jgi:hypothetical protein
MSFLVDLSPLYYIKHASDTTYKDYFPISNALEYAQVLEMDGRCFEIL